MHQIDLCLAIGVLGLRQLDGPIAGGERLRHLIGGFRQLKILGAQDLFRGLTPRGHADSPQSAPMKRITGRIPNFLKRVAVIVLIIATQQCSRSRFNFTLCALNSLPLSR